MRIFTNCNRAIIGLVVALTVGAMAFLPAQVSAATCKQSTWRYGDNHYCVGLIQWMLNDEGNYFRYSGWSTLVADQDFGSLTKAQVKAFQTYAQIGVDGIVGPQTWGALCSKAVTAYYGYLNMGNYRAAGFMHDDATAAGCWMPPEN